MSHQWLLVHFCNTWSDQQKSVCEYQTGARLNGRPISVLVAEIISVFSLFGVQSTLLNIGEFKSLMTASIESQLIICVLVWFDRAVLKLFKPGFCRFNKLRCLGVQSVILIFEHKNCSFEYCAIECYTAWHCPRGRYTICIIPPCGRANGALRRQQRFR